MTHPSAVPASGGTQSSTSKKNNIVEGGLSSARSNKVESGHSVPPPSEFPLDFSASILQTTNVPLGPLPSPYPVPPTEAPAPSSSPPSWTQTLKLLVAQSSAISLSPPPSPPATKRPSATSSDATAKRVVRFEEQQNDAASPSPCIPPTSCTHNSCRSSVAMTTTTSRRRYQRRNSKTSAMMMQSMSSSHASQTLSSQSLLSSRFALNSFSIHSNTNISSGNEVKAIAGSTAVGAHNRRSTSSAGSNIGSALPGMNECSSATSTYMNTSNNTMQSVSDCEMQRTKSMPPRIVSEDFGIGMGQDQSSGEGCKRRKLV